MATRRASASRENENDATADKQAASGVLANGVLRVLVGVVGLGNLGDGLLFGGGLYVLHATR